ncbi:MFS-type transporter SLC18B1 [Aphelenchoides besseyi]|nr:MFS-type transporter SLC18B1 [Aphelenchoides besseyi]
MSPSPPNKQIGLPPIGRLESPLPILQTHGDITVKAETDEDNQHLSDELEKPNENGEERPFIALPFMRKIATQLSVEERRATVANQQRSRQRTVDSQPRSSSSRYGTLTTATPHADAQQLISTIEDASREEEESESDTENEDVTQRKQSKPRSASTSSSDSSDSSSSYTRFSDLTRKQWATVGMLAIANLCSTVAFSCIAPFYPSEAKLKDLNSSQIGVVFGVFELVILITAPFLGKYMSVIGSKRMFTVGLLVTGITAILFGFLNFLPAGRTFFWASLLIRCLEALGDACFVTSSFAISAKCFPGRIATIVGIMETFAGLGYTAGPVIGGVLYDLGGFMLPFVVLGTLLILATVISIFLVDTAEDEVPEETEGMIGMLKMPLIWIMVFAVVICAVSLSFFDPTLADHLSSFNLSTTQVSLFFLLCGGLYTISAPLWGMLLDRWDICNSLMLFGSAATVIAMLFVGPSPLLGVGKSLVVIGLSLSLFGVASSALYIPTFQNCLNAVKEKGYEDNFHTYGCVSGIFQAAFAFGAFVGPTIGGFSVEWIGFPWTTTIIALTNMLFVLILIIFFGVKKCAPSTPSSSSNSSPDKRSRTPPEV